MTMARLKLWLVERSDVVGWDEYRGFVIAAKTEDEARQIAFQESLGDPMFIRQRGDSTWREDATAVVIGNAMPGRVAGVILSEYNAG